MEVLMLMVGWSIKWLPIAVHTLEAILHVLKVLAHLNGLG